MPITYEIDAKQRLVVAHYTGELSIQDSRDFIKSVTKDPAFGPDFRLLAIFSGTTSHASVADFRNLADWRKELPGYKQVAVVVTTDYEFGMARMYDSATNTAGASEARIFRSLEEAREWLKLSDS